MGTAVLLKFKDPLCRHEANGTNYKPCGRHNNPVTMLLYSVLAQPARCDVTQLYRHMLNTSGVLHETSEAVTGMTDRLTSYET